MFIGMSIASMIKTAIEMFLIQPAKLGVIPALILYGGFIWLFNLIYKKWNKKRIEKQAENSEDSASNDNT